MDFQRQKEVEKFQQQQPQQKRSFYKRCKNRSLVWKKNLPSVKKFFIKIIFLTFIEFKVKT